MKAYRITYDTIEVVVFIENDDNIESFILRSSDDYLQDIVAINNILHKKWSDDLNEEINITDITYNRGVVSGSVN